MIQWNLEPQISGCSASIAAHSSLFNAHSDRSFEGRRNHARRRWNLNFDRLKPEEAEIRRLFALTMDNMNS